jgi:hypothetical protein
MRGLTDEAVAAYAMLENQAIKIVLTTAETAGAEGQYTPELAYGLLAPRLSGKTEDALSDDVALDFRCAATDA